MAEWDEAEQPFINQLVAMGWTHVRGSELPAGTRAPGSPLLSGRLAAALRRINVLPGQAGTWLADDDVDALTGRVERLMDQAIGSDRLHDLNLAATEPLIHGEDRLGPHGKNERVHFIDWREPSRNDFLVVSQFRVATAGRRPAVPDLVLFVNGIPLAVVECKSPLLRDPLGEAIQDLRAYAGHPDEDDDRAEAERPPGIPSLFTTTQLLIAASGDAAVLGTIDARAQHYAPWRSVEPDYKNDDALYRWLRERDLVPAGGEVTNQHKLIAVVLRPDNLLNIVRHYVIELPVKDDEGRTVARVKVVCRHQQYRAVEKIVARLRTGRSRLDPAADEDERGGLIWHTQGSGKSLTMAFLARRLRMHDEPEVREFTLLIVTDRSQLQDQLSETLRLSESEVRVATSQADVEGMLRFAGKPGGRAVIFAMIQKYLGRVPGLALDEGSRDDRDLHGELEERRRQVEAGERPRSEDSDEEAERRTAETLRQRVFALCSESDRVLVLIDEAHRSHASVLHACLRQAVPNAARIGFTGTPILKGRKKRTAKVFGPTIDSYKLDEAERDKVVVPIRYEGRTGPARVVKADELDQTFTDLISPLTDDLQHEMRKRYGNVTPRDVAESASMIRAKAADMLRHYVLGPLAGGFKAQVAATSRRAAVMYRDALRDAREELLDRLRDFDPESLRGVDPADYVRTNDRDDLLLLGAWRFQEILRRIDFVPVISEGSERKTGRWREWTDENRQRDHIARFLRPIPQLPPDRPWDVERHVQRDPLPMGRVGLNPWSDEPAAGAPPAGEPIIAFLIVKSMLLTGFDAPIEQVLYLDRPIQDAELLQAVARVNRPAPLKDHGLVVDYYGVLANLTVTLAAYRDEADNDATPLDGMRPLTEEIPGLRRAAEELSAFLAELGIAQGLDEPRGRDRAVKGLRDPAQRAAFDDLLGAFTDALDRVLPHEEALRHVGDAQRWVLLQKRARSLYRDAPGGLFSLRSYGRKVRALIADHLELPEIRQEIAPVPITDPHFDQAVETIAQSDVELAVAEQVHGLRYHLEQREKAERPLVYKKLSESLDEVLREFDGRWEEINKRLGPLLEEARRQKEDDPLVAALSPAEKLLHSQLHAHLNAEDSPFGTIEPELLRDLTHQLCETITAEVGLASWDDREEHLQRLQNRILLVLRKALQKAGKPRDRAAAEVIARSLTGHVQAYQARYRQASDR
ncbi:type I restriction endonuclease subunit R [Streptomyces mayteni]